MKHKYLSFLSSLLVLVCGVTVIVRNDLIFITYMNTHENQARVKAFKIVNAIKMYRLIEGVYPATEYACQSNYAALCLQELVESSYLEVASHLYDGIQLVDRLGIPYNLQIRGITLATNDFNKIFGKTTDDVIVWSSGANGINEHGNGDDVVGAYQYEKQNSRLGCQLR